MLSMTCSKILSVWKQIKGGVYEHLIAPHLVIMLPLLDCEGKILSNCTRLYLPTLYYLLSNGTM